MRYLHAWLEFMAFGKPPGNLLRRLVFCQLFGY